MLKIYLNLAWRNLLKNTTQSMINITGLSIGMAAAVMILLWVQNERSYDGYHDGSERIYRISYQSESESKVELWETTPYPMAEAVKEKFPEIEQTATLYSNSYTPPVFSLNGELFNGEKTAYISNDWLSMFKYKILEGNAASFLAHPHSLMLTQSSAEKYFGKNNAMGKTMSIDSVDYEVRAVVADNPANSSFQFDILIPMEALTGQPDKVKDMQRWGNHSYFTFVKLRSDASISKLEREISVMATELKNKQWKSKYLANYVLFPITQMHFENLTNSRIEHGDERRVTLFSVFAALLILIACINYVNLVTAKASLRTKEVSIKKISGAGRMQLFIQFFAETALISFVALLFTILLVTGCLPFFNEFTGRALSFSLSSGNTLMILAGTIFLVIILSSIYPALLLSSFKPISVFRGAALFSLKDAGLRKSLVVLQFTVSIILIIGVIVIYKQQQFIRESDSAFNRSQIFSFKIPVDQLFKMKSDPGSIESTQRRTWYKTFKQQLAAQSNIKEVTFTQAAVHNITSQWDEGLEWDGKPEDAKVPSVSLQYLQPDFHKFFGVKLVSGRWLRDDPSDYSSFLINETAKMQLGVAGLGIGKRISINNIQGVIVGVVKDFHFQSFHDKIGPLLLANYPEWYNYAYVKTFPGNTRAALTAAENVFKRAVPGKPFEYQFLDESFDAMYRAENKTWVLLNIFTGLILFVSCLGIFGLAAHTAEIRTKEIGIRKVLGATISGITALLTRDFVKLLLLAILLASPIAWWMMTKWLQDFAYRIEIQLWMFVLAGVSALLIAIVTVSFQAIKAAMANPVKNLRTE